MIELRRLLRLNLHVRLWSAYQSRWGAELALCAVDGTVVRGPGAGGAPCEIRALALSEALRWGEAVVLERRRHFIWAVPLMHNQQVLGGLVASLAEDRLFPGEDAQVACDVRAACRDLLQQAEAHNLVNAALLAERRDAHRRERERAEAIHAAKSEGVRDAFEDYRRSEGDLLRAVHAGDRPAARAILNRVLVAIYHRGGTKTALIKSLLMELVIMLCRAGVESGGRPDELFGANWDLLQGLHDAEDEEAITHWLVRSLERIMEAIGRSSGDGSDLLLRDAVERMRQGCDGHLDRDTLAREAGLSPAALTRGLMQRYGKGFTDVLNQMRIDRAKRLLAAEDNSLLQVALSCGFDDPSYFTKVFRRHEGVTPSDFRKRCRRETG